MATLLHELLIESASRYPGLKAIEEKSTSISYQALNEITNKIANLITSLNHQRGQRIGILTHKSILSYQAIYSILKSGCAYVPLDRRAPADRLNYICNDCEIDTLVVTTEVWSKLKEMFESSNSVETVIVLANESPDSFDDVTIYNYSDINSQPEVPKQEFNIIDSDLAYILYTSGSTGKPKGVMISHHISMSFVKWACTHTRLTTNDRVSGHAPLHFDLSIFDIYATAMAGATLIPVPDGASTFPSRLLDWMITNQISVWYSVPSILSMMTKNPKFNQETYSNLRLIIFAGEVFPVPYLKQWLTCLPKLTFMNWYGPTETNVITSYTIDIDPNELSTPVPIGSTTSNADLYCLDESGNLITEIGQSGELYARGPCVALGYWGDKEKTDAKFLSNKSNHYLKDRTFKTGDIVTLDKNGNYIFQGRNDHLIKSRGYRIELGEVEAAFYKQEMISEVAVIPFPDDLIGNKLVAFVATQNSSENHYDFVTDAKNEVLILNKLIVPILPSYMLPSEIKILSVLPKTSNGKIDRQKITKNEDKT